jgi:hypothetical protein
MTVKKFPDLDIGDEYACAECGAIHVATDTRETMLAEAARHGIPPETEGVVIVCDDCFRKGIS